MKIAKVFFVSLVIAITAACANTPTTAAAQPAAAVASPAAPNVEAAEAGRALYTKNCSRCHGFNMVNPGTVSYDLRKFPGEDPERFFTSVLQGKGSMPAWKESLTQEQVKLIWSYVQTGGKK
jgi:mono/diheme cytochrome c family protein